MYGSRRSFPRQLVSPLRKSGAQNSRITAREIIKRIQKNVGVPWRDKTVDTFKAGNPDTPVTGIATSFGGTLDVLRRAAASGKNFVIVHEPTFYSHEDKQKNLTGEIYRAKRTFIDKNGLCHLALPRSLARTASRRYRHRRDRGARLEQISHSR